MPVETVAMPLLKAMVVAVPKATAVPVLSVTVGAVEGFTDEEAPVKVTLLSPP